MLHRCHHRLPVRLEVAQQDHQAAVKIPIGCHRLLILLVSVPYPCRVRRPSIQRLSAEFNMRRWSILIAFGLASIPALAQVAATPAVPMIHPAGPIHSDGLIRDSVGAVSIRPVPDATGELPAFLNQVDYLRKHNDSIEAIDYLRRIAMKGDILPQHRARAIIELADCLETQHQEAEALCWLKIWIELYPTRPEMGAIAYRMGTIYTKMGLPDMARDAYYLALAHSVNEGQVQDANDLKQYTRLTVGTLWAMAANEYESGQWTRAAELFDRFQKEAPSANPATLEKAAFLQADCYYQLKQADNATKLYEETLKSHPFNPLAPQARLRLYHLYVMKNAPDKAREELEALAWTVRTVWPKDETYWQRQTAELLLAINKKNAVVLLPLLAKSAQLPPEGKTWQEALNHYDALVNFETATTNATMDSTANPSGKTDARPGFSEESELVAMNRQMNQLLPPPDADSNQ
jgi:outer membrane protein assembly factor BamD (BamD/ComL family)